MTDIEKKNLMIIKDQKNTCIISLTRSWNIHNEIIGFDES